MGEAFGDFNALESVTSAMSPRSPARTAYTEGAYVTGNGYNGIRDFLAGRPMGGEFPAPGQNPDTDPLNYSDIGFDNVGPEVHADGEIWVAVQIDLRDLFLQRYPSSGAAEDIACVRGQKSSNTCPGDRRWIQLYFDAMVMMPRNATMQDAGTPSSRPTRPASAGPTRTCSGRASRCAASVPRRTRTSGRAATRDADTDPTPTSRRRWRTTRR